MQIVSRKEAKECGQRRYFTGIQCIHGHICERKTINGQCIECSKEMVLSAKKKNKEKYKAIQQKYRDSNREKCNERCITYRKNNPEKRKQSIKKYDMSNKPKKKQYWDKYREKNLEKIRKKGRDYSKANPHKMSAIARNRRARILGGGGKHTPEQIKAMLEKQKKKCINCKKSIAKKYHVDHIMPIAKGGSNDISNIQLLCPTCNHKKNAKDPIKWAQENGRLL